MVIRNGRRECRRRNQSCWLFGESTISRSIPASRNAITKMYQNAGVYVLDAGHFALDTKADEIAALVLEFMKAQK